MAEEYSKTQEETNYTYKCKIYFPERKIKIKPQISLEETLKEEGK